MFPIAYFDVYVHRPIPGHFALHMCGGGLHVKIGVIDCDFDTLSLFFLFRLGAKPGRQSNGKVAR